MRKADRNPQKWDNREKACVHLLQQTVRGSEALSGAYLLARLQAGGLKPAEGNYPTARKTHRPKPRLRDSANEGRGSRTKKFCLPQVELSQGKEMCLQRESL